MKEQTHKTIIAGPCALESEAHALTTVHEAQRSGVETVRMNLWKPRTKPGYEGVGYEGLPWLQHAAAADLGIALEVMNAQQAELVLASILETHPHAIITLWIGSRNQNHVVQREIGGVVAAHPNTKLLLKNQPWKDRRHWVGIAEHAASGGAKDEQLIFCHRGYTPWDPNSTPLRNIPDLDEAQAVKEETRLPVILDPSHIGGAVHLVRELAAQYQQTDWIDGQIIEVHPNPAAAVTDAKQQLTWQQLRELNL